MKKILIVFSIIIILLIPSTIAITKEKIKSINYEQFLKNSTDNLPDLVIEDIFIEPGNLPEWRNYYATVKNIGNGTTEGAIYAFVDIESEWYFIGKKIKEETLKYTDKYKEPLAPNQTLKIKLIDNDYFVDTYKFKFEVTINPDNTIEESNYENNVFIKYFTHPYNKLNNKNDLYDNINTLKIDDVLSKLKTFMGNFKTQLINYPFLICFVQNMLKIFNPGKYEVYCLILARVYWHLSCIQIFLYGISATYLGNLLGPTISQLWTLLETYCLSDIS